MPPPARKRPTEQERAAPPGAEVIAHALEVVVRERSDRAFEAAAETDVDRAPYSSCPACEACPPCSVRDAVLQFSLPDFGLLGIIAVVVLLRGLESVLRALISVCRRNGGHRRVPVRLPLEAHI